MDVKTTISISKKNREMLARKGRFGQSFDDIISELIERWERNE